MAGARARASFQVLTDRPLVEPPPNHPNTQGAKLVKVKKKAEREE